MSDEEKVKAKWPDAHLSFAFYGTGYACSIFTGPFRRTDFFTTVSEAWADAAARIEKEQQ